MDVTHLVKDEVHFGFDLSREVNARLQRAAASVGSRTRALRNLRAALRISPEQLETLVALYKFHFYRGNLDDAEDAVFQALVEASRQGGFDNDWNQLDADSADWHDPRGPGRIYLYSLKALAFIRLRQELLLDAEKILATLRRLDPEDAVGADVVRELLEGINEQG